MVLDLFLFYIFFESVLIPLFFIVGIWGVTEAKIRASMLLFLYTLAGSLFMLLCIMVLLHNYGTTDLQTISTSEVNLLSQIILFLGFFIIFCWKFFFVWEESPFSFLTYFLFGTS